MMVQFLINKGCNLNIKDFFGNTPLHIIVKKGNYEITKILLENNCHINIEDQYVFNFYFFF